MAQNDLLKRYVDAGMAFTAMTQQRAEGIVKDLVKTGEMQASQAQAAAQELFERSRKNTEKLLAQIRREVRDQVGGLGLATKADIARLDRKITSLSSAAPARSAAKKASGAKKTTVAKKASGAKKAAAKKTTVKKSSGRSGS